MSDAIAPLELRRRPGFASLVLCGCCVFWGLSFPLMPLVSAGISSCLARHGLPANELNEAALLNCLRFAAAAVLTTILASGRWRGLTRRELLSGFVIGICYAGGMLLQTIGLRWILPSLSGVITALVVVFAPLAQALIFRQRVGGVVWISALVALMGMAVLAQRNPQAIADGTLAAEPPFPYAGQICTLIGALFFTGHVLSVDRLAGKADPLRLTCILFITIAVISGLVALIGGGPAPFISLVDRTLFSDGRWLAATAALIVLCSVVSLFLMNAFQPAIPAAVASVIYCLEPVFATGFSLALGQEHLTAITCLGGGLVVGATLLLAARRGPETKA